MPWHIVEGHSGCPADRPFAVVKDADGSVSGCHPSRGDANRQLAALNAAEATVEANSLTVEATTAALAPLDEPFPVPEYPPAAWFDRPDWLEPGQGLTVRDDGQVAGYFYQAGQCIVHDHAACPDPSPTGYAPFHQGEVRTAEGTTVRVGAIGNVGGHASPFVSADLAQRVYADPNAQVIVCRAGDDEHGGWVAGALVPGVTYRDVAMIRRCALSGDWRPMPAAYWRAHGISQATVRAVEGYDCIGPTLVTRPGLPIVQAFARTASAQPVLLGGLGGVAWSGNPAPGGPTVKVTLPDGTVVEHTDQSAQPGDVRFAQGEPVAGPPPEAPVEETPEEETAETETVARLVEQVAALEERVAGIEAFLQEDIASEAAAIAASVPPFPARP